MARLQVDSYRTAYAGLLPAESLSHFSYEEQEQDWRDLIGSPGDQFLLVAEADSGEIVGYALGGRNKSGDPEYAVELIALHVRKERQRQGVGRALIEAVACRFRSDGHRSMLVCVLKENEKARRVYEGLGGRLLGEQESEVGEGVYATEVVYGWPDISVLCPR